MKFSKKDQQEIIEKYKKKTLKKCYKMELFEEEYDGELKILDDKLGGKPYLPVGEKYPTDKRGNPMPLLLQINLKHVNLKDFPKQGILEVFTNIEYPMEYEVKLFEEGLEYQTEFPETKAYYNGQEFDYFIKKPLFVKLKEATMHMPTTNYKSLQVARRIVKEQLKDKMDSEELDNYLKHGFNWDWFGDLGHAAHDQLDYCLFNIGGYPNFTQDDPRPDLKPKKDECVFSLDPIGYDEYIEIGDSGTMWGFISKEDLKNGKFENMFVDYDCC